MKWRSRSSAVVMAMIWLTFGVATAPASEIESQIQEMIRAGDLRQTQVSAMVVDVDQGTVLAAIDPDEPMIPASNMKLLTTAAALDVLGTDFVFRTTLALLEPDAAADAGDARGAAGEASGRPSLLIRGDGDPAFGDPVLLSQHTPSLVVDDLLDQWVQAVLDTGQTRFDALLVDDRVFDRTFHHATWPEDQLINRWCAQVAGLNFYRNTVDVQATPNARAGAAPRVDIFPPAPFLQTRNRARTGDNDAFWISRLPGTNQYTFHGTVRHRPTRVEVTVHDPPLFFAGVLQARLAEQGVTVDRIERVADDAMLPATRPLHVVQTTLPLVLMRVNQDSQNMFAEALIKRMGQAVTGEPGSWENGAAAVRFALRQRLGTSSAAVSIADGSGMSRDNRITARLMVDLLRSMYLDEDPLKSQLFLASLARAGENGTLRRRMGTVQAEVAAKTGYVRGVSALSGYVRIPTAEGESRTFAFSFLFNGFAPPLHNHHMQSLQDRMVETIEQSMRPRVDMGG